MNNVSCEQQNSRSTAPVSVNALRKLGAWEDTSFSPSDRGPKQKVDRLMVIFRRHYVVKGSQRESINRSRKAAEMSLVWERAVARPFRSSEDTASVLPRNPRVTRPPSSEYRA